MKTEKESIKELIKIPGVGKTIAKDLWGLGYYSISDLKKANPEEMYIEHNFKKGTVQDICMLYTFRCAVYYANTLGKKQDPNKLKWWNWMDKTKISSIEKDKQIHEKIKKKIILK